MKLPVVTRERIENAVPQKDCSGRKYGGWEREDIIRYMLFAAEIQRDADIMNTKIYFMDGKIVAESGEVKVYKYKNDLYLEIGPGHNLWADSLEIKEYKEQLKNIPKGDCLEIGLGLGIVSEYILSCPNITSLTTIEINRDVVEVQHKINPIEDKRHKIIIGDGIEYVLNTSNKYDFIFIDNYTLIDKDTLDDLRAYIFASKRILNKNGIIKAWWDIYTSEEFEKEFFELFK